MKGFLARYTALVWGILKPLGAWGVFGAAFADSAFLGIPVDPIVAAYVHSQPAHILFLCMGAAAGSALGSSIPYWLGYKGGELFLSRRVTPQRLEELRQKFERHEFLGVMLPAMMPPPMPFKAIVFGAGVFRMNYLRFLGIVFLGRVIRVLVFTLVLIKFGPGIWNFMKMLVLQHYLLVAIGMAVVLIYVGIRQRLFAGSAGLSEDISPAKPLAATGKREEPGI